MVKNQDDPDKIGMMTSLPKQLNYIQAFWSVNHVQVPTSKSLQK